MEPLEPQYFSIEKELLEIFAKEPHRIQEYVNCMVHGVRKRCECAIQEGISLKEFEGSFENIIREVAAQKEIGGVMKKQDPLLEELKSIHNTLISIVQNQQDIFESIEGIQLDLDELKAPLKKKLKVRYKKRLETTNPSKLLKEFEEFPG